MVMEKIIKIKKENHEKEKKETVLTAKQKVT